MKVLIVFELDMPERLSVAAFAAVLMPIVENMRVAFSPIGRLRLARVKRLASVATLRGNDTDELG